MTTTTSLAPLLERFFTQRLMQQRQVSPHTISSRRVTLPALEFIARFLQHVLPRRCAKVRYYGIWSSSCRKQLDQARALLGASQTTSSAELTPVTPSPETFAIVAPPDPCPHCHVGQLIVVEVIRPQRKVPP